MPENNDEQRFSEEEFALILRRAIELAAGSAVVRQTPPPKMPPGGLTLSDIREIAVEVGISPARIREAGSRIWSRPDHMDPDDPAVAAPSESDYGGCGGEGRGRVGAGRRCIDVPPSALELPEGESEPFSS